jgi:pyruvate/2-oxoglutarate dehydrogenase complex dihydrolipoamide acyltransferase (E2) component
MATGTAVDVVMPQMGVSVSEGTITKWLKQEGEHIAADEPLLEISTDKVDTEIPSPAEGVVQQILVREGETVDVGTKLAVIAPEGAAVKAEAAPEAEPEPPAPAPEEVATQEAADEAAAVSSAEVPTTPTRAEPEAAPDGDGRGAEKTFVSPVVARIAAEHGVDPGQVPGTGRGGRVTKKDILAFVETGAPPKAMEEAPAPPAAPPPVVLAPAEEPVPIPPEPQAGEELEPVSAMRRGIAEHMRRSLDTAAHVTSAIEVDLSRVVAAR